MFLFYIKVSGEVEGNTRSCNWLWCFQKSYAKLLHGHKTASTTYVQQAYTALPNAHTSAQSIFDTLMLYQTCLCYIRQKWFCNLKQDIAFGLFLIYFLSMMKNELEKCGKHRVTFLMCTFLGFLACILQNYHSSCRTGLLVFWHKSME